MKHVIAFATISACLLVLSGGAALANGSGGPNSAPPPAGLGTGQPGGAAGAQCGMNATNYPPGQNPMTGSSSSINSPILSPSSDPKVYAGSGGAGGGSITNPNAKSFSNYDVACSQKRPGQMP
jgi:hypothetical protein